LAILEYDKYATLRILNLTALTLLKTMNINDTIFEAHFLDSSNTLMLAICQNSLLVVNLTSNVQYSLPPLNATVYDYDMANNIFACVGNTLTQYSITINYE